MHQLHHLRAGPLPEPELTGRAVERRAERAGDGAFLFDLFAASQGTALAGLEPALREALLRHQFAGQAATYRANAPDGRFEIVECGGVPVGRVASRLDSDALVVVDIAVLPAWQGRGIGTAVLGAMKDGARAAGVPLRLAVLRSNAGARRLYRRLGFVETVGTDLHIDLRWTP